MRLTTCLLLLTSTAAIPVPRGGARKLAAGRASVDITQQLAAMPKSADLTAIKQYLESTPVLACDALRQLRADPDAQVDLQTFFRQRRGVAYVRQIDPALESLLREAEAAVAQRTEKGLVSSPHPCVSWSKGQRRWRVGVRDDGQRLDGGRFVRHEDAVQAASAIVAQRQAKRAREETKRKVEEKEQQPAKAARAAAKAAKTGTGKSGGAAAAGTLWCVRCCNASDWLSAADECPLRRDIAGHEKALKEEVERLGGNTGEI